MTGKDYPDWGGYPVSGQSYPLKDLAEAVVRLGSPVIYDRRGAVAFMETFENGIGRWLSSGDVGYTPFTLTASFSQTGGFSGTIYPGPGVLDSAGIEGFMPIPPPSLWGLSIMFSVSVAVFRLNLRMRYYDGTLFHDYVTSLLNLLSELYVSDDTGADKLVDTIGSLLVNERAFHFYKMVIDTEARKILRLRIDERTFAVNQEVAPGMASAIRPYLSMQVWAYNRTGGVERVNIDNVILTYNESD